MRRFLLNVLVALCIFLSLPLFFRGCIPRHVTRLEETHGYNELVAAYSLYIKEPNQQNRKMLNFWYTNTAPHPGKEIFNVAK